jgi:hypothetical protein
MQRLHFTCTVQGCDRQHKARGYCQTHYMQIKRGVPITETIKSRVSVKPDVCVEEGCHEPVKAKGLCKMHYQRLLRHGYTRNPGRTKPFGVCSESGCEDRAVALGKCHRHYAHGRKMRTYGITQEQHDALFEQQGGKCWICEEPETMPDGRSGKTKALAVDHCHETGLVRGLLCGRCNRGIGLLKDSPDLLGKAIQYLLKPPPFPPS